MPNPTFFSNHNNKTNTTSSEDTPLIDNVVVAVLFSLLFLGAVIFFLKAVRYWERGRREPEPTGTRAQESEEKIESETEDEDDESEEIKEEGCTTSTRNPFFI